MINCPNCQTTMKLVKTASTNPGFFVKFFQCPQCGGLWFDRFDMPQIPTQEAFKIDLIDEKLFKKEMSLKTNLFCPEDGEPLTVIKDINIPPDSQISRCHQCEGVWLNRGELASWKKFIQ